MKTFAAIVAAAAMATTAMAAISADKIASLPGWSGDLPSDMYSGYLNIPGGKHLSYVVVNSEGTPATDPVVFWFNGGPGCSSLGGFATENGPFFINHGASGGWELRQRPERWNKNANTVYLENPAGVGYSYADNAQGYVHNDTSTAVDNFAAVQEFFKGWPEWTSNDLFLTGESYAGIYIPTLAYQIVNNNKAGVSNINLKGIAVGNGCIGTEVGTCGAGGSKYNFEFLSGQGFLSPPLVKSIETNCDDWVNPSGKCQEDLVAMFAEQGNFNVYDVYVECGALPSGSDSTAKAPESTKGWTVQGDAPAAMVTDFEAFMAARFKHRPATDLEKKLLGVAYARGLYNGAPLTAVAPAGDNMVVGAGSSGTDGPCAAGNAYSKWFNDATVRAALHKEPSSKIGAWTDCTSKIDYTSTEKDEPKTIYPTLIDNMFVLIYNGAFDNCVPWTDNAEWTYGMGYTVSKGWHPWYVDSHLAGHAVYWDAGKGFGFTTIQAAGHLVPEYQPKFGTAMLQSLLAGAQL
mmetsp:Transcript_18237/g.45343  ORF Transcript_18237/g.45343 Transcript_18237/m.45343 type:complete len:518 (-) Transcript_18237:117-1670(-)